MAFYVFQLQHNKAPEITGLFSKDNIKFSKKTVMEKYVPEIERITGMKVIHVFRLNAELAHYNNTDCNIDLETCLRLMERDYANYKKQRIKHVFTRVFNPIQRK